MKDNDLNVVRVVENVVEITAEPVIPTMLTIKETAERTNLPEFYIRNLVWENKIPYLKAGKKYLVNLNRFIDYLNAVNVR